MSTRHKEQLLSQLCPRPDTLALARQLLDSARLRTGPGSGYELGSGAVVGLPALCAVIASERLGYGDVPQNVAQVASCLEPKVFRKALDILRAALSNNSNSQPQHSYTPSPTKPKRSRKSATSTSDSSAYTDPLSYESLVREYRCSNGDFMSQCMRDAEELIMKGGELEVWLGQRERQKKMGIARVAVFCWVCGVLKLRRIPPLDTVGTSHNISPHDLHTVVSVLEETGHPLADDIRKRVADVRAALKMSPTKSKAKTGPRDEALPVRGRLDATPTHQRIVDRAGSKSPTKSALRAPSVPLFGTPNKSPEKRRVVFDSSLPGTEEENEEDAMDVEQTPSRRRGRISGIGTDGGESAFHAAFAQPKSSGKGKGKERRVSGWDATFLAAGDSSSGAEAMDEMSMDVDETDDDVLPVVSIPALPLAGPSGSGYTSSEGDYSAGELTEHSQSEHEMDLNLVTPRRSNRMISRFPSTPSSVTSSRLSEVGTPYGTDFDTDVDATPMPRRAYFAKRKAVGYTGPTGEEDEVEGALAEEEDGDDKGAEEVVEGPRRRGRRGMVLGDWRQWSMVDPRVAKMWESAHRVGLVRG